MFRNIQLKIIVVFFLIGIIVITGLGLVYIQSINDLEINLTNKEIGTVGELAEYIEQMRNTNITALIVAGVVFLIAGILIAIVLSRFVIYPINKLIKSGIVFIDDELIDYICSLPSDVIYECLSVTPSINCSKIEERILKLSSSDILYNYCLNFVGPDERFKKALLKYQLLQLTR